MLELTDHLVGRSNRISVGRHLRGKGGRRRAKRAPRASR
jgi:hypothetical protein